MVEEKRLLRLTKGNTPWFYLPGTPSSKIKQKLAILQPLHQGMQTGSFPSRMGQTLEIAVFRALCSQNRLHHFGHFKDLEAHDDSTLYSKEEPPSALSGRSIHPLTLDFIVSEAGRYAGLEVKNVREWMYPDREDLVELLYKCCRLDIIPVFIARRIPFVTFKLMNTCGVIIHETFNQRFPTTDAEFAAKAQDKTLLGYHDVRVGNEPDARLIKFIHQDLPNLLPTIRPRFDEYKDLLQGYAEHEHSYKSFAARVGRRSRGEPEDFPEPEPDDYG